MNDIIEQINNAQHIVVIAHTSPDADSLGSASAMYTYILTLHKKVSFFCITKKVNPKLSFLPWFDKIRNSFPSTADLAIGFDCGSFSRLGIDNVNIKCDLINIDHHFSNTNYGKYNLVDSTCISTTQVLYNLFVSQDIKINKKIATSLYAGLLDDSDGLMSDDVDGTTFAMSKALIEYGADYKQCNKYIMKYLTLSSLRLKAIMLQKMQLLENATIAVFLVTCEDMRSTGARGEDCEYALEESLYLPTVSISILLRENEDMTIKGSIRSEGTFDSQLVASKFNGGGHKSRAGFSLSSENTLEESLDKILHIIKKEI